MKPTVLFVDDEPSVTAALKRRLRNEPYRILEAHSGKEALQVLEREKVDVIVTDEKMPVMSGSELLAEVRLRYPDTIRMVLTGHASLDAAMKAINEGQIYRFLLKPCNEVELMVSIRLALEQKRLEDQNRELKKLLRKQTEALRKLEDEYPGITNILRDETGAILIREEDD